MAERKIEIVIAPDGTVRGDLSGFRGKSCRHYAKILAELVGEEASFDPSDAYYSAEVDTDIQLRDGGGE